MDFFANDLSIHGQFHGIPSFRDAFERLMAMRRTARRFGRDVYSHRALLAIEALPGVPMQQALGLLAESERRAAMAWLTRGGPFWDDLRCHDAGDWLECRGDIVTDTAIGEAAYRTLYAVECGLVSLMPSDWTISPIEVIWRRDAGESDDRSATLENWWDAAALESRLREAAQPVLSWDDLREVSTTRFRSLIFAGDCFEPLAGLPFAKSAAQRIAVLFDILDRFARAFDTAGVRTPEGQQIYQDHFTGDSALFSDSSNKEKRNFRNELTFPHPGGSGGPLFCTWHGKVRHMTLRLHYWWSGKPGEPVYVVYAGPKITKQ